MWKTTEGSTGRLIQLCLGYFFFYVLTGVSVKYFTGSPALGFPGMKELEFAVYSTIGGILVCLAVVFALRWYNLKSNQIIQWGKLRFPQEVLYIIPSGVCTAVVIPTTTLMYTLPISVMVAMVIMRASIIVISRIVDAIQIQQRILKKKVYTEENFAVVFALLAAGVNILWVGHGDFDFLKHEAAVIILGSYIVAYAIRIYIMNYYKNTRAKGVKLDNQGFFSIEQIAATVVLVLVGVFLFKSPDWFGGGGEQITIFRESFLNPKSIWTLAFVSGMAYGGVAFFSVFIFMFKGRTATFAGLVNRLTSLVAGTTATLSFAIIYSGKFPKIQDWVSLVFILIAVGFLTIAERKRTQELVLTHEIETKPATKDFVAVAEKT
ncbi:MAG: hypothetical protein HY707_08670 [Ignavibacteriae bacterium]|nr:hypothetical protein [Ignavibacteriota bacterium]